MIAETNGPKGTLSPPGLWARGRALRLRQARPGHRLTARGDIRPAFRPWRRTRGPWCLAAAKGHDYGDCIILGLLPRTLVCRGEGKRRRGLGRVHRRPRGARSEQVHPQGGAQPSQAQGGRKGLKPPVLAADNQTSGVPSRRAFSRSASRSSPTGGKGTELLLLLPPWEVQARRVAHGEGAGLKDSSSVGKTILYTTIPRTSRPPPTPSPPQQDATVDFLLRGAPVLGFRAAASTTWQGYWTTACCSA